MLLKCVHSWGKCVHSWGKCPLKKTPLKRTPFTSKGKSDMSKLISKLDSIFSMYIRLRDSNDNCFVKCCTCGDWVTMSLADCGHYHDRQHMGTRWDELNCHSQCHDCNRYHDGKIKRYDKFMLKTYGQEQLDLLVERKKSNRKWHRFEMHAMIKLYRDEVSKLKKEKGL